MNNLNIANSIFSGLNDHEGIMICGYEWGGDGDENKENDTETHVENVVCTFSNKVPQYGEEANSWKYDRILRKWFEMWGHPLNREGIGSSFDRMIVQTNWCNTQNKKIEGNYWDKLLADDQVDNFLAHVNFFKPRLILFCGSQLIRILQHPKVLPPFVSVMGAITEELNFVSKPFDGRKFKIGFQSFEHCNLIGLPHPSGTHGLNDLYIRLFTDEIGSRIQAARNSKCV